jgi:integrase
MPASEPIRDKNKLRQLAGYYLQRSQFRNYALIVLGVHTTLRISDLRLLSWNDVYDEESGAFRSHITLTEKKTGKWKSIALNKQAVAALRLLLPHRRGAYIFANNRKDAAPISRVQAWRIVRAAADAAGLSGQHISCHSLRKTYGYHAWKQGVSPVVLMDIFNHSSYEVTRRYLGVTQDDTDKAYLCVSVF